MSDVYSKILILFLFLLITVFSFGQGYQMKGGAKYYSIPDSLKAKYYSNTPADLNYYLSIGYDLNKVIGSINKSKDYTDLIQRVLNDFSVVVLPDAELWINDSGLRLNSNQVLVFRKNSKLKIKPTSKTHFAALIVDEVKNVKIFNANIQGERYQHISQKGQWGMGIRIINGHNIKIYNPYIVEMWGDGIYIGGRNRTASNNIEIHNAILDNNRRNAMSITSAVNVYIKNPLVANANGQSPKAGIDIEPNSNEDTIDRIKIENPICYYNPIYGIVVSLSKLAGPMDQSVHIDIIDPYIIGGKYGVAVLGIYNNPNRYEMKGIINITNIKTLYNALTIKEFDPLGFDLKVNVNIKEIYHRSKRGHDYFNENQLIKFNNNLKIIK